MYGIKLEHVVELLTGDRLLGVRVTEPLTLFHIEVQKKPTCFAEAVLKRRVRWILTIVSRRRLYTSFNFEGCGAYDTRRAHHGVHVRVLGAARNTSRARCVPEPGETKPGIRSDDSATMSGHETFLLDLSM